MTVRLRPLSEDCVDTYTHTWSVGLFLILTIVLLVVPVPITNIKAGTPPPTQYTTQCWCPAQFEDSHVRYTNQICAAAFTSQTNGKIHPWAKIYKFPKYTPLNSHAVDYIWKPENNTNSEGEKSEKQKDGYYISQLFDKSSPVLLLFVLAVSLRLPQMIRSMLGHCVNRINIGRTLASAEKGDSMTTDGRRQMYAGLVQPFSSSAIGESTSCLYVLMKLLMIVTIVAEITIVVMTTAITTEHNSPSDHTVETSQSIPETRIYSCGFDVRRDSDILDYQVQCAISQQQQIEQQGGDSNLQPFITNAVGVSLESVQPSVFQIVLANLGILLVLNVINTGMWVGSLVIGSTRKRLGLSKDSPMDLVLLVLMARANLSIGAAVGLAEASRDDNLLSAKAGNPDGESSHNL